MMKRYANPRGAGTARHYKERWLADIDPPNEDLPIEDVELELLDNEYDDLWLEPDEPDRAEHRRQSDAGLDDDLDTLTDCADPDCFLDPACTAGAEVCDDGIDNDGDLFIDCVDAACEFTARCAPWTLAYPSYDPGTLCSTGASVPCHAGRISEITRTCKPILLSCY